MQVASTPWPVAINFHLHPPKIGLEEGGILPRQLWWQWEAEEGAEVLLSVLQFPLSGADPAPQVLHFLPCQILVSHSGAIRSPGEPAPTPAQCQDVGWQRGLLPPWLVPVMPQK